MCKPSFGVPRTSLVYIRVAGDVLLASVDCIWAYGMCFSKWCELCLGLWTLLEFCSGLCGLNPFWMVWSVSQWQKPAEIGGGDSAVARSGTSWDVIGLGKGYSAVDRIQGEVHFCC